jgi:hypothetical protein
MKVSILSSRNSEIIFPAFRVRCGSLGCGVAQLGCGVAQIVARRLAVRQARVRISLGTPEEALYRAESNEDNKSGALRVVYIKYCMSARLM